MKTAIKAALLSGLVFPGLGHVILKRHKRGAVLMVATLFFLVAFVIQASRMAISTLEKVQSKGGSIDMETISAVATQSAEASDSLMLQGFLLAMAACWIFGVMDAFMTGRKLDMEGQK